MYTPMRTVVSVTYDKPPTEQAGLHNRWHPDIPVHDTVKPGEAFKVECLDWTGGQIKNNDSADDIKNADLNCVHFISGPIGVEGAMPGDVLLVEILEIQPFPDREWGFTGIFSPENGGGYLQDVYPEACKAIWDFEGIYASSRHVPHVRFPGLIHPGLMGCAPSHELLAEWNRREKELVDSLPAVHNHYHGVANLPQAKGTFAGLKADAEIASKVGEEGARTIPGREHGGNCDIKNLSRGSKIYYPVYVEGAKLSVGDLHFSQGDGEITFCGAIEMAGIITLKVDLIKGGMSKFAMKNPIFLPGPVQPNFGARYLTFEGISVDDKGKQHFLDVNVSFRNSCLNAIEYLKKFGYSGYQAYLLLGAAPIEGHISGIVDIPNACTHLGLPVDMFDFDILPPKEGEIKAMEMGKCAM